MEGVVNNGVDRMFTQRKGDLTHDLRDILIWMSHYNPYPARVTLPTAAQKSRHSPVNINVTP